MELLRQAELPTKEKMLTQQPILVKSNGIDGLKSEVDELHKNLKTEKNIIESFFRSRKSIPPL
jgi:hypothetical protein